MYNYVSSWAHQDATSPDWPWQTLITDNIQHDVYRIVSSRHTGVLAAPSNNTDESPAPQQALWWLLALSGP